VAAVLGSLKPFAVAAAGDVISEQFDIAEEVMFIEHGAAWMTVRDDTVNDDVIVGVVNEGGVLGEMEHKRRSPRLVTYKGACRCTILAISKDSLDEAFSTCRDSARRFATMAEDHYAVLLQALRATTAQAGGSAAGALPGSQYLRTRLFVDGKLVDLVERISARGLRAEEANPVDSMLRVPVEVRPPIAARVHFFSHRPSSWPGSGISVSKRGE
jgi:CRP-like cAMP-binding protein